jgi:hypothetical protein
VQFYFPQMQFIVTNYMLGMVVLFADVKAGDELVVDGGMVRFEVLEKVGPDVKCKCTDPGILLPCANLTVWRDGHMAREKSATLPTISSKVFFDLPKIYLISSMSIAGVDDQFTFAITSPEPNLSAQFM